MLPMHALMRPIAEQTSMPSTAWEMWFLIAKE